MFLQNTKVTKWGKFGEYDICCHSVVLFDISQYMKMFEWHQASWSSFEKRQYQHVHRINATGFLGMLKYYY